MEDRLSRLKVVEVSEDIKIEWCAIFNTYQFFDLHRNESSVFFSLIDTNTSEIQGVCHFTPFEDGQYLSPRRGTFGGFELRENDLEVLIFFVGTVEAELIRRGCHKIVISTAPFHHNPAASTHFLNLALTGGYSIVNHEINYAIAVDEVEMVEKMKRNNKKRLKKCTRENFTFEQVFGKDGSQRTYDIIAINRKAKGHPLTMTFPQILDMSECFPDHMFFFCALHNAQIVASSICIRINAEVLYVFYWGDIPGYEEFSPITFLANGIYKFAQANRYKMIDVGISTVNGIPNFGLIKFKENLGFTESIKLTYSKNLVAL